MAIPLPLEQRIVRELQQHGISIPEFATFVEHLQLGPLTHIAYIGVPTKEDYSRQFSKKPDVELSATYCGTSGNTLVRELKEQAAITCDYPFSINGHPRLTANIDDGRATIALYITLKPKT